MTEETEKIMCQLDEDIESANAHSLGGIGLEIMERLIDEHLIIAHDGYEEMVATVIADCINSRI